MSQYSYTGTVQYFTAPVEGDYDISAYGAQGGGSYRNFVGPGFPPPGVVGGPGGKGAEETGTFHLTAGETLTIYVGGRGADATFDSFAGGGGGGGTFVLANTGEGDSLVPILIAGGGGGTSYSSSGDVGSALTTGNGYGGQSGIFLQSGGGAGVRTSGASQSQTANGHTYTASGGSNRSGGYAGGGNPGGSSSPPAGGGGFGGGGQGVSGGGGGGGYSGGDGSPFGDIPAGGGTSYDAGTPIPAKTLSGVNTGDGKVIIALELCFLRGTRILTPTGTVPVQDLAIGDAVMTRFGAIRPVKWVGRQSYDARFIRDNRDKLPVCIHAGALGSNTPARDLYVSPGHSLLLGDTLVLARNLVNGLTVTQDWTPPVVDYFNIELESHDCVVAEGAWAETFADGPGLRDEFHNAADYERLYPYEQRDREIALCAPRPESGPELDVAIRPVVARAVAGLRHGSLRGFVDLIEDGQVVEGWAQDENHPELPVLLEELADGGVLGTVLACDERHDLVAAHIGTGRCAFRFIAPLPLSPAQIASLQVRRKADAAPLLRTEALGVRDAA